MTDGEFLRWLHQRLIHVYMESPNLDFVQRLDKIAGYPKHSTPPVTAQPAVTKREGPDGCSCLGVRRDPAFHHPTCEWRVERLQVLGRESGILYED